MVYNEENNNLKEKQIEENSKKDNSLEILKEKEKLYQDSDLSPDVRNIIEDAFTDMIKDRDTSPDVKNIIEDPFTDMVKDQIEAETLNESFEAFEKEENEVFEHKIMLVNELESLQRKKIIQLEEKIEEYNARYSKLEETTQEYEDRNRALIEKRIEFDEKVREVYEKTQLLDTSKNEYNVKTKKLDEARERFKDLSISMEEKKIDIQKLELKLKKMERSLDKNRRDIESKRIELEKEKLDFESGLKYQEKFIRETEQKTDEISKIKKEEKGKGEILQDILQELSYQGDFQSCFVIDGKGMIISEHSNTELNTLAIGAMFSLVSTALLRTVNSLGLQKLKYFKIAATNGEFMLKNIDIKNYERHFILLAYYDESKATIPNIDQSLTKSSIKPILKILKKDLFEYREGAKITWIFDNLLDRINFLKQKYYTSEADSEMIRRNLLDKTTIKIKLLFET
ncbi:MAG: hypothetical protein V3V33_15140 [Candidatus Lokiarchaeia archaeon]